MKNQHLKGVSLIIAAAVALAGCKSTDWSKVKYEVTPNPLEMHGDSVVVTVKGTIPEKVFQKKDAITVTPSIKWNGGEKALKPISFQGTKVKEGTATKVDKKTGHSFTYTDKVAFQPEMKVSELTGKAVITKKKKTKEYDIPKLADGVTTTPLLVMADDRTISGKDAMPKTQPMSYDCDIHFVISKSDVRASETKMDDVKGAWKFINDAKTPDVKDKKGVVTTAGKKNYDINGIGISAYASPDGEQKLNANLAQDRADETAEYFMNEFKKNKSEIGLTESFYSKTSVAEDWEGFKGLMEASNVPDKEMIIRILTTYPDLDKREQEMKNISKAYTEIADEIMPKLRRAKITIKGEKLAKTDDELKQMSTSKADSLTVEELLYAGNLYESDPNTQTTVYVNAARVYPNDWRVLNNLGVNYMKQNKMNEAQAQFEKADKAAPNNPVIQNNLAIVARWKGDRQAAIKYLTAAQSAGAEATYNMGIINILKGDYTTAISNFGDAKTFNAALAQLLAGNFDAALMTLDASKDKDSAMGNYLKAIIYARKKDDTNAAGSIKSAISKDASLKAMAKDDREFIKLKDNSEFKSAVD